VRATGAARLALVALSFSTCAPAASQTAPPAGTVGYSAVGTMTVSTAFGGNPVQLAGDVKFEARGALSRVDILSVGLASAGLAGGVAGVAGASMHFLPPGGVTIVFDGANALFTIWVPSKRTYFTVKPAMPNAQATPVPGPSASPAGDSNPFGVVKTFSNLQALSMGVDLSGHDVIDGHPTTDFTYHYDATDKSGSQTSIHGTAAFADDFGETPLHVTMDFKGKSAPESTADIALTSLKKGPLPDADFAPPPGYAKVNAVTDLFGGGGPLLTPPH
jgi:hypothetical protein